MNPLATWRLGRILRAQRLAGCLEIPLLAVVAAFLLSFGTPPFAASANGLAFMQKARFDWVAPGDAATEEFRSIPDVSLARPRIDGNYTYTPELVAVTAHLVRTSLWSRYQEQFLGANLSSRVPSDEAVLDEQTARALGARVGGQVVILAQLSGDGTAKPVTVAVGAIVPVYTEPGTNAGGLLALPGRLLGANAVLALSPAGRPERFGVDPARPAGAVTRGSLSAEFADGLLPLGSGPATSGTLLLGGLLWIVTMRRFARRKTDRDRRSVALLVTLGTPRRRASAASVVPFLTFVVTTLAIGALIADKVVLLDVQDVVVSPLALLPLGLLMLIGAGLVGYGTYRSLHSATDSDRLARTLMEAAS